MRLIKLISILTFVKRNPGELCEICALCGQPSEYFPGSVHNTLPLFGELAAQATGRSP